MNSMRATIHRAAISFYIFVLDYKYKTLGQHLTDVEETQKAVEIERKNILMRRVNANAELNKLGGI